MSEKQRSFLSALLAERRAALAAAREAASDTGTDATVPDDGCMRQPIPSPHALRCLVRLDHAFHTCAAVLFRVPVATHRAP